MKEILLAAEKSTRKMIKEFEKNLKDILKLKREVNKKK
jgi:hypothetical protein